MDPTRVADRVWRVTTPLPFRPRAVHAYLAQLEGGAWMLVDGGVNTDEAWAALDHGVRRVVGGWAGVALHVVTHMHLDHIGLSARVRAACGARLLMGELDAERAAHAAAHPDEERRYRERLLREHGAPRELIEAVQAGREAASALESHVPAHGALRGHVAALEAAQEWQAVWTPGHTAGHVGLYRGADGLLLAGDAVLPRVTPTIGVNRQREDPVADHLASLARLGTLRPALVLPGHGDPITEPEVRIAELREACLAESAQVLSLLPSEPTTAWQVAHRRHAHRELPPSAQLQALRETLAHLDHLVAAGRAAKRHTGDAVRFWHP